MSTAGQVAVEKPQLPPKFLAAVVTVGLTILAAVWAALVNWGDGFAPRVATIDAVAGLVIGAFLVDRLITFVKPWGADTSNADQRTADVDVLRLGYGAVLAALFVSFTDLRAVNALSGSDVVSPGFDRAIAVLALAGGMVALARIQKGLNPPKTTDPKAKTEEAAAPAIPPPSNLAYLFGIVGLIVGALIALTAIDDKAGVELLQPENQGDGTVALVVRFGVVLVAAVVVQEILGFVGKVVPFAKQEKPLLTGAIGVVLGVVAARLFDLYLLHNVGFFGTGTFPEALGASGDAEHWGDAFLTGVVIAAGTTPLHDLGSRLRKAKK